MNTLTKNLILIVLFVLSFCQFIHAQQIDPPKRDLNFIVSDENEVLESSPLFQSYLRGFKPTYASVIKLKNNPNLEFRNHSNESIISRLLVDSRRMLFQLIINNSNISKEPLDFLYLRDSRNVGGDNYEYTFTFLANSKEQAQEYAEAFIKSADYYIYSYLKLIKDDMEYFQEIIRDGKSVISKMESEYREIEKQKNKLYKEYEKANYLSEDKILEVKNIVKVKEEMAHSLREVDFELVGLDAKMESINKYKLSRTIIDDETLIKLNQILIATDIERAGAIAKKQAFEASFKQANQLQNLMLSSKKASSDLSSYKNAFISAPETVVKFQEELKNPHDKYKYTEIVDNKVTIKSVKQN